MVRNPINYAYMFTAGNHIRRKPENWHPYWNSTVIRYEFLTCLGMGRERMKWADVTHEKLQAEKEIKTSFGEILSWDYYQNVRNHPVDIWNSKTFILFGGNDRLTEKSVLDIFRGKT